MIRKFIQITGRAQITQRELTMINEEVPQLKEIIYELNEYINQNTHDSSKADKGKEHLTNGLPNGITWEQIIEESKKSNTYKLRYKEALKNGNTEVFGDFMDSAIINASSKIEHDMLNDVFFYIAEKAYQQQKQNPNLYSSPEKTKLYIFLQKLQENPKFLNAMVNSAPDTRKKACKALIQSLLFLEDDNFITKQTKELPHFMAHNNDIESCILVSGIMFPELYKKGDELFISEEEVNRARLTIKQYLGLGKELREERREITIPTENPEKIKSATSGIFLPYHRN